VSTVSLFVNVLGPVVILVAIGAFSGPRLSISGPSLSSLAYWVLGPAFVFNLFTSSGLETGVVVRLAAAGIVGMAAALAASVAGNQIIGSSPSITAASAITSAYGNVGNAGLAIAVFALGDAALPAAGVMMLTINVLGITLGVGLAARDAGIVGALRRALAAPMTLAALAAIALNVADLGLPLVADRSIQLLAGALIPVMLFTLGLQLAATGVGRISPDIGIAMASKLAIAPIAAVAAAAGLGLGGDLLAVVAIQSAMPPAVFCMVLAMETGLEPERVTSTVVATTVASLVTLPVVLALTQ
jgi:predicted permease